MNNDKVMKNLERASISVAINSPAWYKPTASNKTRGVMKLGAWEPAGEQTFQKLLRLTNASSRPILSLRLGWSIPRLWNIHIVGTKGGWSIFTPCYEYRRHGGFTCAVAGVGALLSPAVFVKVSPDVSCCWHSVMVSHCLLVLVQNAIVSPDVSW